jgi:hypothetical protein
VELAASTPVKALKSGAALMMPTPANDAAWVTRYQATTERLRTREAAAKAGVSAQEVADPGDARGSQSQLRQSRVMLGLRCPVLVGQSLGQPR